MTGTGYPQSGLTALLDALERELLAAPADEVRDAWRKRGRERNIARQEVRAFLNEAIAASEEGSAEHCRPTAPAWIGFPAFRESFELPSLPSARQCFSCLGPPPALTGRAASETRSKRLLRVQLSCCRQASPMSPLGALQPMADGAAYGRRCPFAVTRCDQPRRL